MRVLSSILILLVTVFSFGCASGVEVAGRADAEADTSAADALNPERDGGIRSPGPDALVENTLPEDGAFQLAAMSPGYYDSDKELSAALDHAGRQLAIYYGAVVVSQEFLSEQTGSTYAARRIEIRFDEDLAKRLRESCVTGLSHRGKNYFVTRVSCSSVDVPNIPMILRPADENGRPVWVEQPPRIEGYITAVGSVQARRSLAESWDHADREGMAGIAESLGTLISSREALLTREGGAALKAESYVISSQKISGMFVIARWRDPDRRNYYSLVVKKKG